MMWDVAMDCRSNIRFILAQFREHTAARVRSREYHAVNPICIIHQTIPGKHSHIHGEMVSLDNKCYFLMIFIVICVNFKQFGDGVFIALVSLHLYVC